MHRTAAAHRRLTQPRTTQPRTRYRFYPNLSELIGTYQSLSELIGGKSLSGERGIGFRLASWGHILAKKRIALQAAHYLNGALSSWVRHNLYASVAE